MKIQISHLKEGLHVIELSEKPEKFDLANSEFFKNKITVSLEIDKQHGALYIKQTIQTKGEFLCDRCAEPCQADVASEDRIVYTSDREMVKYDDELRYLSSEQHEIDITGDVRDAAFLAIPAKKLCKEDCKGICSHCGANLNHGTCDCQLKQSDPRWDALKKLL
jgi:uncharacterized protein